MTERPVNKTIQRILKKSAQLFNRHGVQKVTVQRIADELDLSAGNVHYHFNKKNDIIHAIIDLLESELLSLFNQTSTFEDAGNPKEHFDFLLSIARILWKYRFVFNDILFLDSDDKTFGARFKHLQANTLDALIGLAELSIRRGWTRPIPKPDSTRLLSENLWHIWLNSLRLSQLDDIGPRKKEQRFICTWLTHQIAMMQHYYTEEMAAGLSRYLDEIMDADKATIISY